MKIQDTKYFIESHVIVCRFEKSVEFPIDWRVYLKYDNRSFTIFTADSKYMKLTVDDVTHFEYLKRIISTGLPYIASVLTIDNSKNVLHLLVKRYEKLLPLSFKLAFQDKFLTTTTESKKNEQLIKEFKEKYLIDVDGKQLAIIAIHHHQSDDTLRHFYLAGKEGFLHVGVEKLANDTEVFVAKNSKAISKDNYRFYIVEGVIDFVLDSREAELDIAMKMFFEQIKNDTKAYINIWNKYGSLEFDKMIDEVTHMGYLQFANCEYVGLHKYKLTFSQQQSFESFAGKIKKNEDTFSLSLFSPKEVFDHDDSDSNFVKRYQKYAYEAKVIHCKLSQAIDPKSNVIYITTEEDMNRYSSGGYIFKSISGYITMNMRRKNAYDRIFKGESGIPSLSALIDGKAFPTKVHHRSHIEPLSDLVLSKAFPKNPPTDKQKEAIDIALNTPDIALIQGPPGTGKTTVIVGILERLNELAEGEERRQAKNLVTAFQHDAVQNVAERVHILDLPTIKFGGKSTDNVSVNRILKMNVENWINEKVQQLYEAYPNYRENKKVQTFDRIYQNYLLTANTIDESLRLLLELQKELTNSLDSDLESRLSKLIIQIDRNRRIELDPSESRLIRWVSFLPDHEVKYGDNGPYIVKMVIRLLEREDDEHFEQFINFLNDFLKQEKKPYKSMKNAKQLLLLHLKPTENIFNTPKQRSDILQLFKEIGEYLNDAVLTSFDEEERILLDYIEEYELNPLGVQNAILDYMSVIGATNQQSVSTHIQNTVNSRKQKDEKTDVMLYDNVIIDEAARSNPLDLFIPMSRAERRIILVGDHRQLPHIVDEQLIDLIDNNSEATEDESIEDIKEKLQVSLFETLFKKLKEQEKKDGIKRIVTLDRQYRTHPLLGDFVSKNFYEANNEGRIESGLPASLFAHQLPGLENKAAVWMDVPYEDGAEISGQSKCRPIEAKKIVAHLKSVILSPEAKGLNFGIITFYAEQVKEIYQELVNQGIARKKGKSFELLPEYAEEFHNGRSIEKLRVGTVDAFQGMEFDFVYLSMVRSNTMPDKTEKQRQRKYGFLMIENRLCVSMSRQKKMLMVVGDKTMLDSPNAHKGILPIQNFYNYCVKDETYGQTI